MSGQGSGEGPGHGVQGDPATGQLDASMKHPGRSPLFDCEPRPASRLRSLETMEKLGAMTPAKRFELETLRREQRSAAARLAAIAAPYQVGRERRAMAGELLPSSAARRAVT